MNIAKDTIIGELVAQNYRTASVFKNSTIDFCCNGYKTIEDVCTQKKIESDSLIAAFEAVIIQSSASGIDYNSWPLDLLADYIENKHHRYVASKIQEIVPFPEKVVRVYGDYHPELKEVKQLFEASAEELTTHMKKEEMIFSPFIRKIVEANNSGTAVQIPFATVQNLIRMMIRA